MTKILNAHDKNGTPYEKGRRVRLVTGKEGTVVDLIPSVLLDGETVPVRLLVPERHELLAQEVSR